MDANIIEMDKIEIAEARLQDTICGYFAGNHATTTIDNARAVTNIMRGVRDYCAKNKLMPRIRLLSDNNHPNEVIRIGHSRIRNLSNFAKHAERGDDAIRTSSYSKNDGTLALFNACVDFSNLMGAMCEHGLVDVIGFEKPVFGEHTRIQALICMYVEYINGEVFKSLDTEKLTRQDVYNEILELDLRVWRQHEGFYLNIPGHPCLSADLDM